MSTAAVFLDIEKAFERTCHPGLLYKLSELELSTILIKLIGSFLTDRKLKFFVEGEFSTPRKLAAGVLQSSVLAPILYSLYINDDPAAPEIHLALFAEDTSIYATEKHERRVLCKLKRGLTAVNLLCERWNLHLIVPDGVLQLDRRDIIFVNNITYLGVTFDRRMAWRPHIERAVAKALLTYVRTYFYSKVGV
jgi:hypothetical protein